MTGADTDLARAAELRIASDDSGACAALIAAAAAHPADGRVQYAAACVHDALGREAAAVPFYERALTLGLPEADLCGAYLGLGSTLRVLGRYEDARRTLTEGRARCPNEPVLAVFLAMTLHNLGAHAEAMGLLLRTVADTSGDAGIARYGRAIGFYADRIDQVWAGDGLEC